MTNTVAILGRPNVGKSTIFNRFIKRRDAIVEDEPGVTRDRLYGHVEWAGRRFSLIDTGGLVPNSDELFESAIREQARVALDEADVVLFVVDARSGLTAVDKDIADFVRKASKPVLLVVNKADTDIIEESGIEFYELGLGEPYGISALNGRGTGDLLDDVVALLPKNPFEDEEDTRLKLALVGRPNVGKSSITNALLGEERSIVTDQPGTTRDSVDSVVKYYGEEIVLVDTAGLRKRKKVSESIELYSVVRTIKAIARCEIAIVVIDAEQGFDRQDARIITEAVERRKGVVIVVNKWDLIEKDSNTAAKFEQKIHEKIPMLDYIPILFISALTKQRLTNVIQVAKSVHDERNKRISTSELIEVIIVAIASHPPPAVKGKDLRINYIVQPQAAPPVFLCFTNYPELVPEHYTRFLENTIRRHYGFMGAPITIVFKQKNKIREQSHSTRTM
ncbi:MAG: ribosome biogenesis GTPase Der [Candidatus Kapaibacterium sp.]